VNTNPSITEHVGSNASEKKVKVPAWYATGSAIVLWIAAAKFILQLLTASRYGFFGDELYFLACSEHLDWGYVDQPPLIAIIAWINRKAFGESLFALHFLPAIAGFALVWLTGLLARELGARRFGMALAALGTASANVYFILNHLFTMNAFEPLLWMGCAYFVLRIINTGNQRLWLWFGVLAGLGLENKYSMGVFGLGIVIGFVLTKERRAFARPWIYLGGLIAFVIFLPNLIWNIQHHWPFAELMRNIRASGRDVELGPVQFFLQQILGMNAATFPIWFGGLLYLFTRPAGRKYCALGWAYLVTLVFMIAAKGKIYYVAPAYPMLMAAGGIALEGAMDWMRAAWLKPVTAIAVVLLTILTLPVLLPLLPVETYLRYQSKLPIHMPATEKDHMAAALPHHFAWEFGWEEMVAAVGRVYNSLAPEERSKAAIFASNFGEAGAIDLLGESYGLPKAICGHQNYWLWGPRNYTGEIMIVVGRRAESLTDLFQSVQKAAVVYNPYARPSENRPILLCRGLKWNLKDAWARTKSWD
jgi:uncharacterized membrane protein YecN with MAPEG domain